MTIKVGDTLWSRSGDYRQNAEKWNKHKVIGETNFSWLLEPTWKPAKCNKKTMSTKRDSYGPEFYTAQGKEDYDFCKRNARNIASAVSVCDDPEKLRQIAAIIGKEIS